MVIQWKMRVSRKAAKAQRKRDELREPTLCVSAPLREILLFLPEVKAVPSPISTDTCLADIHSWQRFGPTLISPHENDHR